MNLLVITNIYPPQELGGYGRCIYDFVNSLASLNHSVDVLTSDAPYLLVNSEASYSSSLKSKPSVILTLKLKGSYERGVSIYTDDQLCNSIDLHNINVIRSLPLHTYDGILLGNLDLLGHQLLPFLVSLNIPIVHHIGFTNPPFPSCFQPRTNKFLISPASQSVCNSLESHGFDVSSTNVVYPGVMNEYFLPSTSGLSPSLSFALSQHANKYVLGSPPNPIRLGYAGLIMSSKGLHTIIQSLLFLRDSGIYFFLSVAGGIFQKSYAERIVSFLDHHNLSSYVRFHGNLSRNQLSRFWSRQHIGIFPSIHPEAFGIVGAEIMSSGVALVSSGVGGSRELFIDGSSGLIFAPDQPSDLFIKMKSLIDSPHYLRSISVNGQRRATSFFDVKQSALKLEKLFTSSFYS